MILSKEQITAIDLDGEINAKIKNGRVNELLLLVPTNRKSRNLKKEIISMMPGRSASGINIETIETLSSKILKENARFVKLSDAASVVFIRQSSAEVKLNYFSLYKSEIPFGTLDKIKNVIAEYKRQGIDPAAIIKESGKLEKSERLKALDIASIYEKYLSKCYELNAYDNGDILKFVNEINDKTFAVYFAKLYSDVDLVVVNGFDDFSMPEILFIDKLARIKSNRLFVSLDYFGANKYLFAHVDKVYEKLEELQFVKVKEISQTGADEFQTAIREKLFKISKSSVKTNKKNSIAKIIGYDREKEIELISRQIKELIINEKAEPHKICVACNLIQNYSSIVRDVFRKNGLPFNLSDRTSLDNSNPVTAVINILEIAENDFYYNNLFRALNSGFIDIGDVNVSNLNRVASALKIVSGKTNWINTIQDELNNLKYDDYDEGGGTQDLFEAYKKALKDINCIVEILKPFENKMTFSKFSNELRKLIGNLKLPDKLINFSGGQSESEFTIRGFTVFLETINEIFDLLGEEYGAEKEFPMNFFMDQLRTACGWERFNIKEKSNYGIQVTSLEEIRGLKFDYLFIAGMCDGDLPTRYQPEIFFSGSFKKQAVIHQTEERNLFYKALCGWRKKLFLTYPQTIGGREAVVSTFLNDFEELFEVSVKEENDFSNKIYSLEGLQVLAGYYGTDFIEENEIKILDARKIGKSIQTELERETNQVSGSEYSGDLSGGDEKIKEKLRGFADKQYSISQLENYAKCPFKFFAERILDLKKFEEPTEDIEAVEMGRILHSILYEFYTKAVERSIKISGCDEKTFKELVSLMYEIAEEELNSAAFKSQLAFYEKERIIGIAGDKKESVLYKFLEAERADESGFSPNFFEVSFGRLKEEGSDKNLSSKEAIQIGGIKLRGKIDMVEISDDNVFNVVDYKLSGSKPSIDYLKDGISLQLPVYLYAAGELLRKKFNKKFEPGDMIIYSLKYSLKEFGKDIIRPGRNKNDEIKCAEDLIKKTLGHIKNYVEQISNGKFGLSPHENREQIVCQYCQFKPICRVEG